MKDANSRPLAVNLAWLALFILMSCGLLVACHDHQPALDTEYIEQQADTMATEEESPIRVSIIHQQVAGPLMCDTEVLDVEPGTEITFVAHEFEGFTCISEDHTSVVHGPYCGTTFFYVPNEDVDQFIGPDGVHLKNPILSSAAWNRTDVDNLHLTPIA